MPQKNYILKPFLSNLGLDMACFRLYRAGLLPGTKYLGSVAYSGTSGLPNPTIVTVNP